MIPSEELNEHLEGTFINCDDAPHGINSFIQISKKMFEERELNSKLTPLNKVFNAPDGSKIHFYKCDRSNLFDNFNNNGYLQTGCITKQVDDNYNIISADKSYGGIKYHVLELTYPPPKLYVHLFKFDHDQYSPSEDSNETRALNIEYLRIVNGTLYLERLDRLNTLKDNVIDGIDGNIINTMWTDLIPNLLRLPYIKELTPEKTNVKSRLFNYTFVKHVFDEMITKYNEQYNKNLYNGSNTYFKSSPVGTPNIKFETPVVSPPPEDMDTSTTLELNGRAYYQKVIVSGQHSKVCIIGDLHSSLHSLCDILLDIQKEYFIKETFTLNPDKYIIFLGDIVDRGPFSIELLVIISILKLTNFDNVFIINGNHEESGIYSGYGLTDEKIREYSDNIPKESMLLAKAHQGAISTGRMTSIPEKGWASWNIDTRKGARELYNDAIKEQDVKEYINLFKFLNCLPSCIILDHNNVKYHLCHGSFDKYLLTDNNDDADFINFVNNARTLSVASVKDDISGQVAENLQWSDMHETTWPSNDFVSPARARGVAVDIPKTKIIEYLDTYNIKSILSGHQDSINIGCMMGTVPYDNWMKSTVYDGFWTPILPKDPPHDTNKYSIELKDDIKLKALITSTAIYSKGSEYLDKNCYLELK